MLGTHEGTSIKLPGAYQKEEPRRNPAVLINDQDKIETDQMDDNRRRLYTLYPSQEEVPAAKPCTSSRSINIIGGNTSIEL